MPCSLDAAAKFDDQKILIRITCMPHRVKLVEQSPKLALSFQAYLTQGYYPRTVLYATEMDWVSAVPLPSGPIVRGAGCSLCYHLVQIPPCRMLDTL